MRSIVFRPTYRYEDSSFVIREEHDFGIVVGVSLNDYLMSQNKNAGRYAGSIYPEDAQYIITKTEEYLRDEGFSNFIVSFERKYQYPNALLFKEYLYDVLTISLSW